MKTQPKLSEQLQKVPASVAKQIISLLRRLRKNLNILMRDGVTKKIKKGNALQIVPHPAIKPFTADVKKFDAICRAYKLPSFAEYKIKAPKGAYNRPAEKRGLRASG